jgi:hypothetical protein
MFLRKFYNQGKSAIINPLPQTKGIQNSGDANKIKTQGSLFLATSKDPAPGPT